MSALAAVSTLIDITTAVTLLLGKAQEISAAIAKAQAEGRELNAAEWAEMFSADDEARLKLYAAIARAKEAEKG